MPPRKKRKVVPEKTGKTRQYLMDNFCHVPDDVNALKNGHMLFIFFANDQSIAKTIRTVKETLQCRILPHQLVTLLGKSIHKFRNLSRDSDMEKFSTVCSEAYTGFTPPDEPEPGPSMPGEPEPGPSMPGEPAPGPSMPGEPEPGPSMPGEPEPGPSTPQEPNPVPTPSSRSSQRQPLTPREMKLKRRLDFVSQTKRSMKQNYLQTVRELRSQIDTQKLQKIKYLKQEINRKNISIAKKDAKFVKLKIDYSKSVLAQELAETKKKLKEVQRKHKRLKTENKKKYTAAGSAISVDDFMKLQNKTEIKR